MHDQFPGEAEPIYKQIKRLSTRVISSTYCQQYQEQYC
jgi:hypothetical protein